MDSLRCIFNKGLLVAVVFAVSAMTGFSQTPVVHLDASDAATVQTNAAGEVISWLDKSGNGYNAVPTSGSIVTYDTSGDFVKGSLGVVDLRAMDFASGENTNGKKGNTLQLFTSGQSEQFLDFSIGGAAAANDGLAVFIAFRADAIGEEDAISTCVMGDAKSPSDGGFSMQVEESGDPNVVGGVAKMWLDDNEKPGVKSTETLPQVFEVYAFNYDATSTKDNFRFSTAFEHTKDEDYTKKDFTTNDPLILGAGKVNDNRCLRGVIGEVIIYNTKLTDSAFEAKVQELKDKWVDIKVMTPRGLQATPDDDRVYLNWKEDGSPGDLFASFNVYRSTSADSGFAQIASSVLFASYVDADVEGGTLYYYKVTALDVNGVESDFSGITSALPNKTQLIQKLDSGTGVVAPGGVVSSWQDLSGNTNDAVALDGSVLYPGGSSFPGGQDGVDMTASRASLQLFSAADSDEWLDLRTGNNGFCVMLSFKCDGLLMGNSDLIGNSSGDDGFGIRLLKNGTLQAWLGGHVMTASGTEKVLPGDVVNVAFNYDADTGTCTVWDSKNYTPATGSVPKDDFSLNAPVTLGSTTDPARHLNGMVGGVRVYKTRLSEENFERQRSIMTQEWIKRPNIVLLYVDDWAWNGSSTRMMDEMPNSLMNLVEMPNFDKIAKNGMRFSNSYGSPQCTPARATIQSGMSTARHGYSVQVGRTSYFDQKNDGFDADGVSAAFGNMPMVGCGIRSPLDARITSIAEALGPLGYGTAHYGKWHLEGDPSLEGYDDSDGPTNNDDGKTLKNDKEITELDTNPKQLTHLTNKSVQFMRDRVAEGKAFYLQISNYAVHGPNECFKETREYFQGLRPDENGHYFRGAQNILDYYAAKGETIETVEAQSDPAVWLGMAYDLDRSIGVILQELKDLGIADNTYVVVQGDNGVKHTENETTGDTLYPLNGAKWWTWEGGVRVPMLVMGPGVPKNTVCDANVVAYDFLPTFLDWAGGDPDRLRGHADPRENIDGVSLKNIIAGGRISQEFRERPIYFHYPHYRNGMPSSSIIKGHYKATYFYDAPYIYEVEYGGALRNAYPNGMPPVMLFDLSNSIGEYNNIALQDPTRAVNMYTEMTNYLAECGARIPEPNYTSDGNGNVTSRAGEVVHREGEDHILGGLEVNHWKRHENYYKRVLAIRGLSYPATGEDPYDRHKNFEASQSAFMGPFVDGTWGSVTNFANGRPLRLLDSAAQTSFDPVAYSQSVYIEAGATTNITLTGNDRDGDTVTFAIVSTPSSGLLGALSDADVTYTANPGFEGVDYFDFVANATGVDGTNVDSVVATVSVYVGDHGEYQILPEVEITSHENGDQVSSQDALVVTADAGDDSGIAGIELFLSDVSQGVDTESPFEWNLGTGVSTGPRVLRAEALANDGQTASMEITIDVTDETIPYAPEITTNAAASSDIIFLSTNVALSVSATDRNAEDSLTYTWLKSIGPGSVTFSDNGSSSADQTTASFSAIGTYELMVVVQDDSVQALSATGSVLVAVVPPTGNSPYIAIVSPIDGAVFESGEQIAIKVYASDNSGILKAKYSTDLDPGDFQKGGPYEWLVGPYPDGKYTIEARCQANDGATAQTADFEGDVQITFGTSSASNQLPSAWFYDPPAGNIEHQKDQPLLIKADAVDPDGALERVKLFKNGSVYNNDVTTRGASGYYEFTVPASEFSTAGKTIEYKLKAVDLPEGAASPFSDALNVTVVDGPVRPTASITSPTADLTDYPFGATITITANASDSDATVTNVAFYQDGVLIGTDDTAPYSISSSALNTYSTTYTFTVIATDSDGLTSTVGDPSTVTVTTETDPTSLPVLIQHLDASVSNSITGNPVTQWGDQTTNDNHAVQGQGSVLYTGMESLASGVAGLDFGASRNSLELFTAGESGSWLNQPNARNGFCVLVAFKCDVLNTNDWNDLIGNSSATDTGFGMRYQKTGELQAYLNGAINYNSAVVSAGDTVVMAFNYNAGSGAYEFWNSLTGDAVTGTQTAADFSSADAVTLGSTTTAARYFDGVVGEVKIYNGVLSADEFAAERSAMLTKWAVPGGNVPPTVSFSTPSSDVTGYAVGSPVSMTAAAQDTDGSVVSVTLYQNGTIVGTDSVAPYTFTTGSLDQKNTTYTFELVARDNGGATNTVRAVRTVTTGSEAASDGSIVLDNNDGDAVASKTWILSNLNTANPQVSGTEADVSGRVSAASQLGASESVSLTITAVIGWTEAGATAADSAGTFSNYLAGLTAGIVEGAGTGQLGANSRSVHGTDDKDTLGKYTPEALVYTVDTSGLTSGQLYFLNVTFGLTGGDDRADFVIYDVSSNQFIEAQWDIKANPDGLTDGGWQLEDGDKIIIGTGASNGSEQYRVDLISLDIRALPGPEDPYDIWADLYGGDAVIGTETNDYDGDGIPNLVEYAFGGSPTNKAHIGNKLRLVRKDNQWFLIHPKRADNESLTYTVQATTNLMSGFWEPEAYTISGTNVMGGLVNEVSNTVQTVEEGKYFRLQIGK